MSRKRFEEAFRMVNSFHAEVDYSDLGLGEVWEADESHNGRHLMRFHRTLPKRKGLVRLSFVHPRNSEMSLGQILQVSMDYGFRPAIYQEVVAGLDRAVPEQLNQLFCQADECLTARGIHRRPDAISIACLGSAVAGKTGELIPVQELVRACGRSCRLHLRKMDFNRPIAPAMSVPVVAH